VWLVAEGVCFYGLALGGRGLDLRVVSWDCLGGWVRLAAWRLYVWFDDGSRLMDIPTWKGRHV
jgi:hypothetical protein